MTEHLARIDVLEKILPVVRAAGDLIMIIYGAAFSTWSKQDASPVTEADEKAEDLIVSRLSALIPGIPVVAEEAVAAGSAPEVAGRFWLVDPLDGTREFIRRNGEFTVNIALIEDGAPILGTVFAPALGLLFAGVVGQGAFIEDQAGRRPIVCRPPPADGLTVMASRSHGDEVALETFLAGRVIKEVRRAGSSLKICLIAAGEADLYPRLGRTMEWDIAAGHAVLAAAGGRLTQADGAVMRYGKPGFENPHFIARGADA